VPLKLVSDPETCLVDWPSPPPVDLCLNKIAKKFTILPLSSKEEISSETNLDLILWNSLGLPIFSTISLNSLFPSMMVLLENLMSSEVLMKESYPPLLPLNKSLICMKDSMNSLIEVSLDSFGPKDNSIDKMLMEIKDSA